MLARRLTTILPVMRLAEALDATRLHRVGGRTGAHAAVVTTRLCRAPPHASADVELIGGPQPAVIARGPSSSSWSRPSSSHGRPRVLRSLAIRSRPVDRMP